ncbi:methyltransferase domain-containing protein [Gammaproteobacteria bacterium]|nr:methyltransferase domain-containing protein [Gammaproteobacteria bacterium]
MVFEGLKYANNPKNDAPIIERQSEFSGKRLLECSPRHREARERIWSSLHLDYQSSDYDQRAHAADIALDLIDDIRASALYQRFDYVICAHVGEHIPDYQQAIRGLYDLLRPGGTAILQVPVLEAQYTAVTWDEFHGDDTRVFHRFALSLGETASDLLAPLGAQVELLWIAMPPEIFAVNSHKFRALAEQRYRIKNHALGEALGAQFGLGDAQMTEAFIIRKPRWPRWGRVRWLFKP